MIKSPWPSVNISRSAWTLLLVTWMGPPYATSQEIVSVSDEVIRVDVNLRQVDFIVTDAKGKHVSDLQPSDFEVLEDGKPQRITNLSWIEVTPPPSGARLAALREKPSLLERYLGTPRSRKKAPGEDSPVANLRRQEIRRAIAILAGNHSDTAAKRIRKFIDEQVGPGDMVSVRSTSRTVIPIKNTNMAQIRDAMGIFQQFTNDKRQLDAATERLSRVCVYNPCSRNARAAFLSAVESLENLPGRKALLFVGRYDGDVNEIIERANRAGVVIYVLDPEGVVYDAQFPSDAVAQDSERELAEKTGGRRILTTVGFGLTEGLNEVIEDLSGYYLLGYRPTVDESERKAPKRHRIEVRVLRAGLIVRSRDGFMAAPDRSENQPPATQTGKREQILTQALFSVFTQDGVRIHLQSLFTASVPDRKKKRHPQVHAYVTIDGRDLEFLDSSDGKKKVELDVVAAVFDGSGAQAGAENKKFTLLLSHTKVAELARGGLQYRLDVALTDSGPYQVRVAVRDTASGEIGSAYAFLEIPDFNEPRISLSSVALNLPEGTAATPGSRPDWNEFAPGATVEYVGEVFNLKTPGKPPLPPEVTAAVKLYRGGALAATIEPVPARAERVEDRWILSGSLRLPDDLAEGNYMMELLVHDQRESSQKKQIARQWIDVTVVSPKGTPVNAGF